MNTSCQKLRPLYSPEIYNQVIDLPVEKFSLIFILEKEYLELKSAVDYWRPCIKEPFHVKKLEANNKGAGRSNPGSEKPLIWQKSKKKSSSKDEGKSKSSNPKRPRGQQPGSKGHGRTKRLDLPQKEDVYRSWAFEKT